MIQFSYLNKRIQFPQCSCWHNCHVRGKGMASEVMNVQVRIEHQTNAAWCHKHWLMLYAFAHIVTIFTMWTEAKMVIICALGKQKIRTPINSLCWILLYVGPWRPISGIISLIMPYKIYKVAYSRSIIHVNQWPLAQFIQPHFAYIDTIARSFTVSHYDPDTLQIHYRT